jgi:hypothetical protein
VATGRYAIDRIIMEGDNVPILSQNGPYFDTSSYSNMTAVTGDSAILKCRVHNLGNKTVRFHYYNMSFNYSKKVKKTGFNKWILKQIKLYSYQCYFSQINAILSMF